MNDSVYPTGPFNTLVDFRFGSRLFPNNHPYTSDSLQGFPNQYVRGQEHAPRRDNEDPPYEAQKDGVRGSPSTKSSAAPGIILRHSVFLLVLNLISIEFLFDIFYFILKVLPIPLKLSLPFQNQLWPIYFGIFGILLFFKIILMVFAAVQWVTSCYEIRDNEIRYRYGIFSHHEKIFMCTHTQEVTYAQGILGRIFNFGSIEVYSPVIKDRIFLASIPNPQKYAEVIKGNIPLSTGNNIHYYPFEQEIMRKERSFTL